MVLPAPLSSQATLILPGGAPPLRPTLTLTVPAAVTFAALAGFPMTRTWSGSVTSALGPVHVTVEPARLKIEYATGEETHTSIWLLAPGVLPGVPGQAPVRYG